MPATALIINADDLGLCDSVNRGILDAWAQGAISDSSVFATLPDLPTVLAQAQEARLPVGIHLNLTYGQPLSHPLEIRGLVTPDGAFMRRDQWEGPLPLMAIRLELRRQIMRVLELGAQPTHLDSHHHIHRYPEVLSVVIGLATEFNLPLRAIDAAMRDQVRLAGVITPDAFAMAFYGPAATVETLQREAEQALPGVLEMMTHPGSYATDIPGSYRTERAQELAALTDPRWCAWREDRGIALCGFRELV